MARIPRELLEQFNSLSEQRKLALLNKIYKHTASVIDELGEGGRELPSKRMEGILNATRVLATVADMDKKYMDVQEGLHRIFAQENDSDSRGGPAIQIIVNAPPAPAPVEPEPEEGDK